MTIRIIFFLLAKILSMDIDIIITIIVIVITLALFITEALSVDLIAMAAMLVLVLTGIITPQEGVEGFANNATITVMAMFAFSAAIVKTNSIEKLEPYIATILEKRALLPLAGLAAFIGAISAFINNTPVVASFIPLVKKSAQRADLSPSKFLIPLSYISIFGGTCTLIGTSTNLLVNGIATDQGIEPFSMFMMAPLGLSFMFFGILYLFLFSGKLLPDKKIEDIELRNEISDYTTQIVINKDLPEEFDTIGEILEKEKANVKIQSVKRGFEEFHFPDKDFKLQKNDKLLLRGNRARIRSLLKNEDIDIDRILKTNHFPNEKTRLIEIVLTNKASILEKRLGSDNFLKKYNANVLAVRHRGQEMLNDFKRFVFKAGDVLLLETNEQGYEAIIEHQRSRENPFIIMDQVPIEPLNKKNLFLVLATIFSIVILSATNTVPIMIGALSGIVVLSILKVLTMEEVYKSIDWQVIFLLAGSLSLGKAMTQSGLSNEIAMFLTGTIAGYGPYILLSVIYLITTILTGILSNSATVALLAPLAISTASILGISPIPFLMAVAFAGSASFFTPIGYQTNTMVYSVGKYTFMDFVKIGAPLNILFWILATVLIPILYPF